MSRKDVLRLERNIDIHGVSDVQWMYSWQSLGTASFE
jgi:hypothetical protein